MTPSSLSARQLDALLQKESCLILDVRSRAEFQSGHLPGSVHLPLTEMDPYSLPLKPSSSTHVITVCAHGVRSAEAARRLSAAGWPEVYSLEGGLAAWEANRGSSVPIAPEKSCSVGFDRPRSILFGAVHCVFALLVLWIDPQWAWGNLILGLGMVWNGWIGWCGLSLFFRRPHS